MENPKDKLHSAQPKAILGCNSLYRLAGEQGGTELMPHMDIPSAGLGGSGGLSHQVSHIPTPPRIKHTVEPFKAKV